MKKSLLSLFILLGFAALAFLAFACKPKPEKKKSEKRLPVVMVEEVRLQELPLEIESQGSIEPLTETTAAAEVSGQVLSLADNFNAGGVFKKGDILMEIDAADYQAAYAQAQSMLADANLALQQERARGEQAARDWKQTSARQRPSPTGFRCRRGR